MAVDRKAMQAALARRQAEQAEAVKNEGGGDLWEPYFKIPDGYDQFSVKPTPEGLDIGFDIVMFTAGSKYPTNGYRIKKGDDAYVVDVYIHKGVGPLKKSIVCPLKNYGKNCPLCEKKAELLAERGRMENEVYHKWAKEHDELIPKRRALYNVIVRSDSTEEAKGVQIFESSYKYAETKYQIKAAMMEKRLGGQVYFASPDPGKHYGQTIWVNYKLVGERNWEVSGADFAERDYEITDDEIKSAVCLDEMLVIRSYDEILDIMGGGNSVAEPEPAVESSPTPPRRTLAPKPVAPEPVDMGDDVPMGNEPPVMAKHDSCPFNANFGVDFDEFEECDSCEAKDDCKMEKERIENAAKAVEEPAPPARRRKLK